MKIPNCYILNKFIYEDDETILKKTLEKAIKNNVILTFADLTGADLAGANLADANLTGADLDRWIICDAYFDKTKVSFRGKTVEVNFTEVTNV